MRNAGDGHLYPIGHNCCIDDPVGQYSLNVHAVDVFFLHTNPAMHGYNIDVVLQMNPCGHSGAIILV